MPPHQSPHIAHLSHSQILLLRMGLALSHAIGRPVPFRLSPSPLFEIVPQELEANKFEMGVDADAYGVDYFLL